MNSTFAGGIACMPSVPVWSPCVAIVNATWRTFALLPFPICWQSAQNEERCGVANGWKYRQWRWYWLHCYWWRAAGESRHRALCLLRIREQTAHSYESVTLLHPSTPTECHHHQPSLYSSFVLNSKARRCKICAIQTTVRIVYTDSFKVMALRNSGDCGSKSVYWECRSRPAGW